MNVFFSGPVIGYQCHGDISEWTKCTYSTKTPKRKSFLIPTGFENEDFM